MAHASEGKKTFTDEVVDALLQSDLPLAKNGVVAFTVAKTPVNGSKTVVTYARQNGQLVKHFGAQDVDTSHDAQITRDATGVYAYQPDAYHGVSKTVKSDPMWQVWLVAPVNSGKANKMHRYKGSTAGAEWFARWIVTFERGLSMYTVQSLCISDHTLTVSLA